MVKWIVIVVVVLALLILVGSVLVVAAGRLSGLNRAVRRLQGRQAEAMKLQRDAVVLEQAVAGLHERAEIMQARLTVIKAGQGGSDGKQALRRA